MRASGHINGVALITLPRHQDDRGNVSEVWRREFVPGAPEFVQDNVSVSAGHVLRGLHLQKEQLQGKLIVPLRGRIFDVVVDAREDSTTFGRWQGFHLEAGQGLWVPPNLAHGFLAAEEGAIVLYKCTSNYNPTSQLVLAWNDPNLAVEWPLPPGREPVLSARDRAGLSWGDFLAALG